MSDWDRYRRLDEGEIIMEGDEVDVCNDGWRDEPKWVPATYGIGKPAPCPDYPSHRVYRRLKEIDRLRDENERLREEVSKRDGLLCRWRAAYPATHDIHGAVLPWHQDTLAILGFPLLVDSEEE